MTCYNFKSIKLFIQNNGSPLGNIFMRRAVETIPSYSFFLIKTVRKCINKSLVRHCLVKCSIENRNHRNIWENLPACFYTNHIRTVMKRSQNNAFFNCFYYLFINQSGFTKLFTAVYNPVTDGRNFIHTFYNAAVGQ